MLNSCIALVWATLALQYIQQSLQYHGAVIQLIRRDQKKLRILCFFEEISRESFSVQYVQYNEINH